MTLPGLSTGWR